MRPHIVVRLCLALLSASSAAPSRVIAQSEFSQPWLKSDRGMVIDPYEANRIDWTELSKDKAVVGIIHRGTIGMKVDSKYALRRTEGRSRGYRWGSYHLGRPGDPIAQADFYLSAVKAESDEVLALDVEAVDNPNFMTLADARRFLQRVKETTGRWPMIYGNHNVISTISGLHKDDAVFSQAALWYARFRKDIPNFPSGTWKTYTLWQFSSEINCKPNQVTCLYRVPGTDPDMDVNICRGTFSECRALWPF